MQLINYGNNYSQNKYYKKFKKIPYNFGVEIDVRSYKNKIVLNHEPFRGGDRFKEYIKNYKHGTLVVNIKESGIEMKL